jgi:hypothetical protein
MNAAPVAARTRARLLSALLALGALVQGPSTPAEAQTGCTSSTTPIAVGQTLPGELSATDCFSPSRPASYSDRFTFTAAAGTQYLIDMRSPTLDSFLYLRDAAGTVLASNDDVAGSVDARIVYTAPSSGALVVEATSYFAGRTGAYEVSVVATDCRIVPIASGQTVQGSVALTDCYGGFSYDGHFDGYTFDATPGMRYTAVLTTTFFGYVALKSPSGEYVALGEHENDPDVQTLLYEAPGPGTYTLEVSGAGLSVGDYTMTFDESACSSAHVPIALGESLAGELSLSDCFSDLSQYGETFQDSYTFPATAGEIYTIGLASTAFAPFVTVLNPAGQVVAQRGGSQAVPARVNVTAASTGPYRIEASSLYYRQTGAYTVSLAAGTPCSSSTTAIAPGDVVPGSLDGGDCYGPFRPGSLHDTFTFEATAGDQYAIDMTSAQVDSYLYLAGPSGEIVAQDDDSGASFDARIVYTAPSDGAYTIYATTFWSDDVGAYSVSLNAGAGCTAPATPLATGVPATGALAAGDCYHSIRTTAFHDKYTFEGAAGDAVSITMESPAFDTYLYLRDPSGAVVGVDDDGGGWLNSWISTTLAADGVYTVEATSFAANATGPYTVTLGALPGGDCTDTPAPIAIGGTVEGEISGDECGSVLIPSSFRDPYTFTAVAGITYTVSLSSDDFDAVLVVLDPEGTAVAFDDDGGTGLDARLVFSAATSGAYTIEATTFNAGATGAYTLSLAESMATT